MGERGEGSRGKGGGKGGKPMPLSTPSLKAINLDNLCAQLLLQFYTDQSETLQTL